MSKKIILTVLAAGALVFIGFWTLNTYIYTEKQDDAPEENVSIAPYFQEQMITRGIADIGHPIEGFDANLLMQAFPGLTPSDFNMVEAFEGVYTAAGGELSFERHDSQPVSSAERTISEAGFRTLLDNVAARLMHPVKNTTDADTLIDMIDTGERIEVRLNESAHVLGVTVTPLELLEDSRCPIDVQCIQEGTIRVRTELTSGLGTAEQEFRLFEPITTEAERITLLQAEPIPESGNTPPDDEYVFHFEIQKR